MHVLWTRKVLPRRFAEKCMDGWTSEFFFFFVFFLFFCFFSWIVGQEVNLGHGVREKDLHDQLSPEIRGNSPGLPL